MIIPPKPPNEEERLKELYRLDVLDSGDDKVLDEIAKLAKAILGAPIGLITLIDAERQVLKSRVGLKETVGEDIKQTPREIAFCAHAILSPDDVMIVTDATLDERFYDNPAVINSPNVRFYIGAPLVTSRGYPLGTLCTIDQKPREVTPEQVEALRILAKQVVAQMELKATVRKLGKIFDIISKFVPRAALEHAYSVINEENTNYYLNENKYYLMMIDISGFTSFCEREAPHVVVLTINKLFSAITDIIYKYKGDIDKFIGDAILAFFKTPEELIKAALEIQGAINDPYINLKNLKVKTGLHTGNILHTSVGGTQRQEYTLIGDPVNTTQRIQSFCPPGSIALSQDFYNEIQNNGLYSLLANRQMKRYRIKVKGKEQPLTLYIIE
ncbi:MAG: GAF domain-containing protein [Leptospiraceae bacterium]|nr:GAF domain-containing protein [Leptospiraceae bacterium]